MSERLLKTLTRLPLWLTLTALAAAFACSSTSDETPTATGTATQSPSPTVESSPEPAEITESPTATAVSVTPTLPSQLSPTATPSITTPTATIPPPPPTPAGTATPASFVLDVTEDAETDFPNAITFSMETQSDVPVEHVELRFGYDLVHACSSSHFSSVRLEPDDPMDVSVSWDWEMQLTGSIPPGTVVWWHWVVQDESGNTFETETSEMTWEDARFTWQEHQSGNVRYHWYDGDANFGETLATSVEDRLDRMELGATLEKPVEAYIYSDAATLREAVLYAQAWTGGLAFTSQNILLIAVGPTAPAAEVDGLVHELAHLLVREVTFSCIGDMPTWLDEGLAEYAEGPVTTSENTTIATAKAGGTLITIQSLSSSFPADHSGAYLAYAQSKSIVTYLIEEHGWDKMNQLLSIFQSGSTYEGALEQAYGMDMIELDAAWREWLETQ